MYIENNENGLTIHLQGRIDTNNAGEYETEILKNIAETPEKAAIIFDADELEYISSAGLRVLMKVRKMYNDKLPVINVSNEVYEIFDTTGFTELLDVRKKLREISIEGCEEIGAGLSSKVYRIDQDTIVKVFHPGIGIDRIEEERESAKTAFLGGIPTAITFDIVKVGECYGTVYELIDAVQLSKFLRDNPDKAPEYRIKYAEMIKEMHRIHMTDKFKDMKDIYNKWIDDLEEFLSSEELDALHRLVGVIPDRDTFVHCDAHVGNTLVQDGELILIDMADVGNGHPIFDIATLCYHYQIVPNSAGRDFGLKTVLGFIPENNDFVSSIWEDFVKVYFAPKSEKDLMMVNGIAMIAGGLRSIVTTAKHAQMDEQYKRMIIDGFRTQFFPQVVENIELFRNMDVYFQN